MQNYCWKVWWGIKEGFQQPFRTFKVNLQQVQHPPIVPSCMCCNYFIHFSCGIGNAKIIITQLMKNNFASSLAMGINCKELQSVSFGYAIWIELEVPEITTPSQALTLGVVIPRTLGSMGVTHTLKLSTFNQQISFPYMMMMPLICTRQGSYMRRRSLQG